MKEEKLFTAGQFAKVHNLNKRTLQYYDDIGLFCPRYRDEKGYRYYVRAQSPMLEMILGFRELGLPIDQIKEKLREGTVDNYISLFSEYQENIDNYIRKLETMKRSLKARKKLLERSKKNLNNIDIVYEEATSLFTCTYDREQTYEDNFHELAKTYHETTGDRVFRWPMGAMLGLEDAMNENYYHYAYLFIENDDREHYTFLRKASPFLVGYSVGFEENLQKTYQRLFDYAKAHHIKLGNYCYEIGLNDEVYISEVGESINQIMIPIL